jgi:hypothetical protein
MKKLDMYVTFIFIVKLVFIILAVSHIYLKAKGKANTELDNKIQFWKERIEFVFVCLMSILLIYTFFPRRKIPIPIDYEMRVLFFLFGIILILTAEWGTFIDASLGYKLLHNRHKTK